jgi:hypothetical protein
MANEALLFYKKLTAQIESTWGQGTVTDGTKLIPMREDGSVIGLNRQLIMPGRISGRASKKVGFLGTVAPKFTVPAYAFPTGATLKLLKMVFGQVSSAEASSFVVTLGSNDKIDFTEDGGAEVAATLTAGSYTATTLAAEVKAQLESANGTAATYTVTYSTSTKKFTITKNSGVFVIKWATGTNTATSARSLLGFTNADTSSAIAATSDSTVQDVWDHTFTPLDAITYGLSAGMTAQMKLADGKVFDLLDCVADAMKVSYKPNQELWMDFEMEARRYAASGATLAALTEESYAPLLFAELAATVDGVAHELSGLEVSFSNNYKKDLFANGYYRTKFPRNGFRDVKGVMNFDLADSRAYAILTAMDAGTQPAITATFTGTTAIKTTFFPRYTWTLGKVQYNLDAIPGGGGAAAPEGNIPFIALDDGTNGELKLVVRNNESTV